MSNIAVLRGVTPTGSESTTQDYTYHDFNMPTAAVVVFSRATATETPSSGASISVGFITPAADMQIAVAAVDNVATSSGDRSSNSAMAMADVYAGGSINATGSIIDDGIRLVYSSVLAAAYNIEVMLIKGTSEVNLVTSSLTVNGANDITSIGFKPTLCFFASIGHPESIISSTPPIFSFGAAHNSSTDTVSQWYLGYSSADAAATALVTNTMNDNGCVGQVFDADQNWLGTASDFDSDGLTITTSAAPGDDYIFILALAFSDPDSVHVEVIDTPTATGVTSTYSTGFKPGGYLLAGSINTTLNTPLGDESGVLGSFSLGFSDGANSISSGITDLDATATMDTSSYYSDSACLYCLRADQDVLYSAAHAGFEDDGFKLEFDDVDSSVRKAGLIAFRAPPEPRGTGGGGRPVSRGRIITARDNVKLRKRIEEDLREVEEIEIDTAAMSRVIDIIFREVDQEKAVEKARQEERITQIIRETISFEHKQRGVKEQLEAIEQLRKDVAKGNKDLEALIALLLARHL